MSMNGCERWNIVWMGAAVALAGLAGCGDDDGGRTDGGGGSDAGGDRPDAGGGRMDGGPPHDGGGPTDGGPAPDGATSGGGDAHRGEVFFVEGFEDGDFTGRGWYDESAAALTTAEHHAGASAWECRFAMGATTCPGRPGRHMIPDAESVYLSYWVKYDASWVGSGHPYHPHEFHFVTNLDDRYVGPAHTHLTTYIEDVALRPRLAIQDSANTDLGCILRNDDMIVGCGGDFATYPFTEMRSVSSCNGLAGDLDGRDCFPNGDGTWYSSRYWDAP